MLRRLFPSERTSMKLSIDAEFDRSRPARIFYVVFAVTVIMWLTESVHGLSSSVVGFIPVVVLLAMQVFNEKDLQNVQWHVLWLVAGGIALGRGVADSGLDSWLISLITWENIGPSVIAAAFAVVALMLSTVISNSASANLLVPIGLALTTAGAIDLDPLIVGFVIAIGASLAMALPISTPPNAIAYSSGLVKTGDMARAGLIIGVVGLILFLFVSPAIWSVLGIA